MKKFVKYLLAFFTAFLVCFTASCSNGSNKDDNDNGNIENPDPEVPDKPVTKKFNVSFYVNETVYEVVVTNEDGYIEELPQEPTIEGNNFIGWFLDLDKDIEFSKSTKVEKDTNVYAKLFNIENNKLDIEINGSTFEHNETLGDYYKITKKSNVTSIDLNEIVNVKSECKFNVYNVLDNGDKKDNESSIISLKPGLNNYVIEVINSIKQKASYNLVIYRNKSYKITFKDAYNMPNGNERIVEEGTVLDKLETPKRPGYTFVSWSYDFNEPINSDLNVEAIWEQNIYHINLDPKGGVIDGSKVLDVTYNQELTYPTVSKYGFNFLGWKYLNKEAPTNFNFEHDINVYASWEIATYEIKYQADFKFNNPATNPTTFTYHNDLIVFENASRTGYTFKGWLVNDSTTPIMNLKLENKNYTSLTLTPVFEANQYEITLKDGNEVIDVITLTYGEPYEFPVLTKQNYTFVGYKDSFNEIPVKGDSWNYERDKTLYANYKGNTIVITFDNGDLGTNTQEYTYGSTFYKANIPNVSDKLFYGYYTEPFGKGQQIFNEIGNNISDFNFTEDFTVYPVYKYQVTYIDNRGHIDSKEFLPNEIEKLIPQDIKEFEGWYCDEKLTIPYNSNLLQNKMKIYAKYHGETSPSILNYEIKKGNITITGITDKTITDLVIPQYIGGVKVESIADASFQNLITLKNLVLPDTLSHIGYRVFNGCNQIINIKTPFIGESLNRIGDFQSPLGHFFGPNGDVQQDYGGDSFHSHGYFIPLTIENVTVTQQTIFPHGSFQSITSLLHVTIRDDTTKIGISAFRDCINLLTLNSNVDGEINFPSGCKLIPSQGFQNDDKITHVKLNTNTGLTIGSYAFDNCSNLSSFNSNKPFNIYTQAGLIDSIGAYAFQNCKLIKNVYISDATTLGSGFLSGLDNLQTLTIPFVGSELNKINTFDSTLGYFFKNGYDKGNCKQQYSTSGSYERYFVPETLTDVTVLYQTVFGCGTFENFTFLENIEIIKDITQIGDRFLNNCVALQRFNSTNFGEINIPKYVKVIPFKAFYNCTTITTINSENTITIIESYAFAKCTSLTSFNGNEMFDLNVPSFVEDIGNSAFQDLPNIKSVFVDVKCNTIGESAFLRMNSLRKISLPFVGKMRDLQLTSNSTFGYIFYDSNGDTYQYYKGSTPMHCSIPEMLRTIIITDQEKFGNGVFHNLANVETITIPKTTYLMGDRICQGCTNLIGFNGTDGAANLPSIERIGSNFFKNCYQLTNITYPDSVTDIGEYAFSNCYNVVGINNEMGILINSNIEVIGDYAFNNLEKITDIYFRTGKLASFGIGVFSDCVSLQYLTIPYLGQKKNMKYGSNSTLGYLFWNSTKGVETDCYYESTSGSVYKDAVKYPTNLAHITVYDQTSFSKCSFSFIKTLKEINVLENAELTQEMLTYAGCPAKLNKNIVSYN